jgi:DNA-binding MurR/RpiR family transcriptional regulator
MIVTPSDEKTVIQTIREHHDQIFLAEKKVADFIINHPEKAVGANVSELARLSGVSDATVVRLCQHIGYKGYYQMRICLSHDIGSRQLDITNLDNENRNSVTRLFQKYAGDIYTIGCNLSQEAIIESAKLISTSKQTHVVAVGNTSALAQYLGFRLGRIGVRCTYNMVPEYFINHINLASSEDIVVAISKSGSSRQVVQAMELAKERGLKSIAITGHEYSPVSNLADYVLVSSVEESLWNGFKSYSHLAEIAVSDALVSFVQQIDNLTTQNSEKPEIILSEYKI